MRTVRLPRGLAWISMSQSSGRDRILESQVAVAAAEEREEDLPEVRLHLREGLEEERLRGGVDLPDRLMQGVLRAHEIGALRGEVIETLQFLVVLLHGERVHRADGLELLAEPPHLLAQRVVVQLHRRERSDHVVERAAPFRLEPLLDRGAAPRELDVAQLRLVQVVGERGRRVARGVQRVLGVLQARVGIAHGMLRILQFRLVSHGSGAARLHLRVPLGHAQRQFAVRLLDLFEFGAERRDLLAGGGRLAPKPVLAVDRHLQATLGLRLLHLPAGAILACRILLLLRRGERGA